MLRLLLAGSLCAFSLMSTSASEPQATKNADSVRSAVEKSLPYIQREGTNWIEKRKCVSCHQVPFMVWSLNAAAHHGFDVDAKQLKQWNEWAIDWQNFSAPKNREQQQEKEVAQNNVDTIYQLLLAGTHYELEKFSELKLWTLSNHLIASQQEDGSWKPCGQLPLQKRPKRESAEVSTMWTLVALQQRDNEAIALELRHKAASQWLASGKEGKSTEWWAVKLLLDAGENQKSAEKSRDKLIESQHKNGGWGWLIDDESDAFGTGIALYSLSRSGLSHDHPAIVKARRFLLQSQQADGSWKVNGTKTKSAKRVARTASYWGTCWAVIGLLESTAPAAAAKPGN